MITTVTLNATIDKTCFLGSFQVGEVNRVPVMHTFPGGKGINAARVIHALGCPVLATGFTAGFNGAYIENELARQGILHDFVKVDGESRVSLNIIDRFNGTTTEILEQGPTIETDDVLAMKDKIRSLSSYSSVMTICGSIPGGTSPSLYAEFVEIAQAEGAKVILDASGEALLEGIKAKPFCIKPNEQEVAALMGRKARDEDELYPLIRQLNRDGIECVVVTLGDRGAIAGWGGSLYRLRTPSVGAVNTVGCGDSFVGGLAVGLYKKEPLEEILRLAAASGTADALTEEAGHVLLDDVKRILWQVDVEAIG